MNRPVLVLGIEPRISVAVARCLHRHQIPVDLASVSSSAPRIRSTALRNFENLPGEDSPAFYESIGALISRREYDMLIPATDAALLAIGKHDTELRELLYVACPPAEIAGRVLDKSLTLDVAARVGIEVPRTIRLMDASELKTLPERLKFPIIAKPYSKNCVSDFKVKYFQNPQALQETFGDHWERGEILFQEFVPGEGVGIETLMHHGQPITIFQHRRLKEVPATGGAAAVAISETPDPALVEQAIALLRALQWEGVAMVEFRQDRVQGRSALMEVNGRYWGTVELPIHLGVEFPWYEWQIAHGQSTIPPKSYPVGARWRWTPGYVQRWHDMFPSVAKRAIKHPRLLRDLLPSVRDLSPMSHDALWRASDPLPAVSELFLKTGRLFKSDVRFIAKKIFRRKLEGKISAAKTLESREGE